MPKVARGLVMNKGYILCGPPGRSPPGARRGICFVALLDDDTHRLRRGARICPPGARAKIQPLFITRPLAPNHKGIVFTGNLLIAWNYFRPVATGLCRFPLSGDSKDGGCGIVGAATGIS